MNGLRRLTALALTLSAASAFQTAASINRSGGMPSSPCRHQRPSRRAGHHCSVLHQSSQDVEEDEEEYELVEFFVSPEQIALLRKEAVKRDTRKKLPKFFLPAEESREVSAETIEEIINLFDGSELIEVRGVSKESKKQVFDTAHGLAAVLEDAIEKPVVVADIKGFAVKLYCPWDDEGRSGRIQMRTSYKPGQWTRKPKPIRDHRGQIITDESGKSIKEVPE